MLQDSKYNQEEKDRFEKIVVETYIAMQQMLRQGEEQIKDFYGINQQKLKDFFSLFLFKDNRAGACFTLNQDLFFEQKFGWQPFISKTKWYRPGMLRNCGGYKDTYSNSDPNVLPSPDELSNFI